MKFLETLRFLSFRVAWGSEYRLLGLGKWAVAPHETCLALRRASGRGSSWVVATSARWLVYFSQSAGIQSTHCLQPAGCSTLSLSDTPPRTAFQCVFPVWHHQQRSSPAPRSSVASRRARGRAVVGRGRKDGQADGRMGDDRGTHRVGSVRGARSTPTERQ